MAGGGHNSITRPHLLITAPQQHTASNLHSSPPCKVILCNDGGCKKIMLINSLIISYQISPNLSLSTYPELNLSLKSCCIKALFQKAIISKVKNLESVIASLRLWPISYFKRGHPPSTKLKSWLWIDVRSEINREILVDGKGRNIIVTK